jgi:hypothetical protein
LIIDETLNVDLAFFAGFEKERQVEDGKESLMGWERKE